MVKSCSRWRSALFAEAAFVPVPPVGLDIFGQLPGGGRREPAAAGNGFDPEPSDKVIDLLSRHPLGGHGDLQSVFVRFDINHAVNLSAPPMPCKPKCLKETEETEYWLELLVDSGCVSATKMAGLLDETRQLIAIFTTIDKNAKG